MLSSNNEGRIALKALATGKGGWLHHPFVQRYNGREGELLQRLYDIRAEMIRRGYHPKAPIETYGIKPEPFTYTDDEMREDLVVAFMNIARSQVKSEEKKGNFLR